jgi:hypothetical protein
MIFGACQKSGHTSSATDQVAPSPKPAKEGNTSESGPSDGGGGDTCNNKMIESYKVDIVLLPEYKEFVQPVIDKVTKDGSPLMITPFLKTWYIIDCKLKNIPPERKGLYLETYQTAIHTSREIFIDASSYKKMAQEEKGKLLLHEMVMAYYLMKYLSLEDICKMTNTCSGDTSLASKWKMYRPQPYRALNEEDHQKIRKVTAWMWSKSSEVTPEGFIKILKNNDFDNRFTKMAENKPSTQEATPVKVDVNDFLLMIKKTISLQSFPKYCHFEGNPGASKSKCSTQAEAGIKEVLIYTSKIKHFFIKLKITRESDGKVFENEFLAPMSPDEKFTLHFNPFGSFTQSAPIGFFSNWPSMAGSKLKEGDRSHVLYFMVSKSDEGNLEIFQMLYQAYTWYSFEEKIVQKNDGKWKEYYGYNAFLPNESEDLNFESEQSFIFKAILPEKTFIMSHIVAD